MQLKLLTSICIYCINVMIMSFLHYSRPYLTHVNCHENVSINDTKKKWMKIGYIFFMQNIILFIFSHSFGEVNPGTGRYLWMFVFDWGWEFFLGSGSELFSVLLETEVWQLGRICWLQVLWVTAWSQVFWPLLMEQEFF